MTAVAPARRAVLLGSRAAAVACALVGGVAVGEGWMRRCSRLRRNWHHVPARRTQARWCWTRLPPRLREQGLGTDHLAFHGWSMGGYGALRLAGTLGAPRTRAVAALSAALWTDPADASLSGFADPTETSATPCSAARTSCTTYACESTAGTTTRSAPRTGAYVAGFDRPVTSRLRPGAHNAAYWTRMLPAQLAFVGNALAAGLSSAP